MSDTPPVGPRLTWSPSRPSHDSPPPPGHRLRNTVTPNSRPGLSTTLGVLFGVPWYCTRGGRRSTCTWIAFGRSPVL